MNASTNPHPTPTNTTNIPQSKSFTEVFIKKIIEEFNRNENTINNDIIKVQNKSKLIGALDNIVSSCVVLVNLEKTLIVNTESFISRFLCWIFRFNKK